MTKGARPRRLARTPGWALIASALLTAVIVNAVVVGQQPATVTPTVVSPLPVSLTAVPLTGTTVTAGTVASTTGLTPILIAASTLTVARQAPNNWNVVIAVTSAGGITGSESLVLALTGAGTQTLTLVAGTTYPQVAAPLTLGAGGLTVTAATTSLVFGCHTCTATVEIRISPAGGGLPTFVYPYAITTAA